MRYFTYAFLFLCLTSDLYPNIRIKVCSKIKLKKKRETYLYLVSLIYHTYYIKNSTKDEIVT